MLVDTMHFSTTVLLSLAGAALTTPATAAVLGSKKNVYLATCTTRGRDCDIPLLCNLFTSTASTAAEDSLAAETFSAVIYYNGPSTSRSSPSDVGTVSSPARSWEGATRRTSLNVGDFESKIEKGAAELAKSQIAGTAKLGDEELICFRDGEATFQFREGLLTSRGANCRSDYWCASIEV